MCSESTVGLDIVEDPQKVEEAVEHLMHNLPSPTSDHCSTPSPLELYEEKDCNTLYKKIATANSPNKPIPRFKTAQKRPPSTDTQIQSNTKRQKTSPPYVSPVYTPRGMLPYASTPDIKVKKNLNWLLLFRQSVLNLKFFFVSLLKE